MLPTQIEFLDRQLQLAEESSRIEGGAIEVLENLLRGRDIDKELFHALGLKSLEVGLKIRLLETDVGGKSLEVHTNYVEMFVLCRLRQSR